MPDRLYDSRREWYLHETTEHRRDGYLCVLCRDTLNSSKQYERHVARHLEELALFALPRTEMDDAEDDEDDVFDTRASTSADGVAVDNVYSSDHSDHSSLASVTDDDDSTETGVQLHPRSAVEGHEGPDTVDLEAFEERDNGWNVEYPDQERPPNSASKSRNSNKQSPFVEAPRTEEARPPSFSGPFFSEPGADGSPDVINTRPGRNRSRQPQTVYYQDRSHSAAAAAAEARRPRDQSRGSRSPSPYWSFELEKKIKKLKELEEMEKNDIMRDEKFKEELILREAKKAKKKKEDEEFKKKAIEEYHIKQLEEQL